MRWCAARGRTARLRARDFDELLRMLADGFSTRRGRQSAYLHRDAVNRRLRARRGARLTAHHLRRRDPRQCRLSGGARAERHLHRHAERGFRGREPGRRRVSARQLLPTASCGSRPGACGSRTRRGQPPTLPFWLGEAPGAQRRAVARRCRALRARDRCALPAIDAPTIARAIEQAMQRHQLRCSGGAADWWSTWRRPRRCSASLPTQQPAHHRALLR